jgi:hypothetical protein
MDRRIIWPSGMERDRGEEARTGENQRTLVLVSTRTSSDWTRVVSVPATHSPANGLKKWRPGSARRMKRPNFSTTATLAWSTHPQNRKKALTIFPGSSYSGGCARGGVDRSRRPLACSCSRGVSPPPNASPRAALYYAGTHGLEI